ncbi:hypothetical protein HQ590_14000 [bacterium]|nr:hypothetical protein [bacterium]
MKRFLHWVVTALPLAMIACAIAREPMVLDPVGPPPLRSPGVEAEGYLRVYSATQLHYDGIPYYPHSDYTVLAEDGTLLRPVRNASDLTDERPARVRLPVGSYLVRAAARSYGPVIVPVVIETGQTTTVYLEPSRTPGPVPSGPFRPRGADDETHRRPDGRRHGQ